MMSGKKDLEIVYNLQWKNSSNGNDDKANILGMYDIPATTLNWETFKSYLLKNSGATGDDVKVSYVSTQDKEFPIESQLDFQIALYSFRQRARNGDIITLKLDRIVDQGRMGRIKRLRSYEEHGEAENQEVIPQNSDNPPEWFKKYMKELKTDIVEEVTSTIINHVSAMKPQMWTSQQFPCYHSRKSKVDCCKRPRKTPLPLIKLDNDNGKDKIKSIKMERKLDCKLEKLEQKTMKIKEKRKALVSKEDYNRSLSRPIGVPLSDTEYLMDASAIGLHESTSVHAPGSGTFKKEWEIVNSGDIPWTEHTELRYAWGSEALKPAEKIVMCPKLKPGEHGIIGVDLEIPGTDKLKMTSAAAVESSSNVAAEASNGVDDAEIHKVGADLYGLTLQDMTIVVDDNSSSENDNQSIISIADSSSSTQFAGSDEFVVIPMPESLKDEAEKLVENPTNNVVEIQYISNDSEEVPELTTKTDVQQSENKRDSTYAYVTVNGEKFGVPKRLLRPDYLKTAEDAPEPPLVDFPNFVAASLKFSPEHNSSMLVSDAPCLESTTVPTITSDLPLITPKEEKNDDLLSFKSTACNWSVTSDATTYPDNNGRPNSPNKSRLFVFPSKYPGFEVVYPPVDNPPPELPNNSFDSAKRCKDFCTPLPVNNCFSNYTWPPYSSKGWFPYTGKSQSQQVHLSGEPPRFPNNAFNHSEHCNGPQCRQPVVGQAPIVTESEDKTKNTFLPVYYHPKSPSFVRHTQSVNSGPPPHSPSATFYRPQLPMRPPMTRRIYRNMENNNRASAPPPATTATGVPMLVSGAVNVASSAINTARSVLNMFSPPLGFMHQQPQLWGDSVEPDSVRGKGLQLLEDMGFWNRDVNLALLARFNDDIERVVAELVAN